MGKHNPALQAQLAELAVDKADAISLGRHKEVRSRHEGLQARAAGRYLGIEVDGLTAARFLPSGVSQLSRKYSSLLRLSSVVGPFGRHPNSACVMALEEGLSMRANMANQP